MSKIDLPYGRGALSCHFDEDRFQLITRAQPDLRPLTDLEIGVTLDSPIASRPLEDLFSAGDSVLIIVSDATRATASPQIVNLLVRRIIEIGVSPAELAIIFATGIHRPVNPEEKRELLTPFIAQRVRTLDHNAHDQRSMTALGQTDRGTAVKVNCALREYSRVVIVGAIGFHYFAGFTGGRKSICPGLAARETVEATHKLALDFENGGRRAGVGTGLLDGNAVHEECECIAAMIDPSFVINSVVDERGRVVRLYVGHWREAHRTGCLEYRSNHTVKIDGKRDLVLASCGGLPYDLNLIQAHKALDMAANGCRDGGTIVLIAECSDGFGRPDFLKWFAEPNSRALEARLSHSYEVNGQTAWALMTKAERYRILLVSTLAEQEVKTMRMTPVGSLEEALAEAGQNVDGYIMTRGAALLPVVED